MKYCILIISSILFIKADLSCQNDNTHYKDSISISYIANAGFFVEMNGKKIVFDGFFNDGFGKYDFPDSNLIFQMTNSRAPFDSIDMIFVSHYHGDHFNSSLITGYLTQNQNTRLVCPEQVNTILQKDNVRYRLIKDQIIIVAPEPNSCECVNYNDFVVTACRLWHGRKENNDIENIGYILKYRDRSIFHSGDATLADFDGINGYIASCNIDIALLHNSFGSLNLIKHTDSLVNADNYIFMHLTGEYANMFHTYFVKNPEIISNPYIFRESMERKIYHFKQSK
jgi:L-ascorbate metabolism protein UlaG (beta-lactamase superfamily)